MRRAAQNRELYTRAIAELGAVRRALPHSYDGVIAIDVATLAQGWREARTPAERQAAADAALRAAVGAHAIPGAPPAPAWLDQLSARNAGVLDALTPHTPSEIADEQRTVKALADQLNQDVIDAVRANRAPQAFLSRWLDFYAEWNTFDNSHSTWTSRVQLGLWDKVREYRQRVADWRAQFQKVATTRPAPATKKASSTPATIGPRDKGTPDEQRKRDRADSSWVGPVLLGAAGLAAVVVIAKV